MPEIWTTNKYDLTGAGTVSLPGGPARMRLRQIDLPPKATFVPSGVALVQLVVSLPRNAAGETQFVLLFRPGDGTFQNVGNQAITVYLVTLEAIASPAISSPVPIADGSPVASPVMRSPTP